MDSPAPRHLRVLALIAIGRTRAEAAGDLFLSPITVRNYLQDVCEILEARNSVHAVTLCLARGYLCVDHRDGSVYVPEPIDDLVTS